MAQLLARSRTFDLHLASDVMDSQLFGRLQSLGFMKDNFIGGTTGVVHPQHLSAHPKDLNELRVLWEFTTRLLSGVSKGEFFGYAEAEITPPRFRSEFQWKPFDPSVASPMKRFEYGECPLDKYKSVDIHLTADLDTIDPRLQTVLEDEINFHYVDIRRASGSVVRVYTVQPLGKQGVSRLYRSVAAYIRQAGGLQGKIKLEATYAYARFPYDAPVCPVIFSLPSMN